MEQNKPSLESTLKSSDTEEFIDIYFYRPIGYRWALLFQKLGVTPNAVTIASIFIGVGSGICFYFDNLWLTLLGIFLLVWANSFDSADGQLARMTKQFSALGRVLDGFAGNLWFISIYIAICMRLFPVWGWSIWALAVITGYFHSKQASMADYYRNIHLLFLKGKSGSELDNTAELREKNVELTWGANFWEKLVLTFYLNYTKGQESWSANFQEMFKLLKSRFGETAPEQFRVAFREKSLPLMKWTNILSFNTRAIALFVAVLIKQPWLYFVFELVVLNVILVYMVSCHEKMCKTFTKQIEEGKYEVQNTI
ncbi:CDP-alcohol phosphatidyltransferase family protein [Dysgonomonas sp. HDW5A]|uniref:CDP-alcohol phosphatidyltransferase family protein n=1 Tax=Dysgonomonas sp. HDW5A TaxID=2714926 RepID=UPI0014095EAC|nr:CDP-alcohol phosphatidyltransferase family protein [Dysgonomonas sp. HDW5A]QIK58842.1 CDP-alcohol phosphatidyltransferase family protein [Dysgonomonas sp. HDW5A]